ncbi:hypothetical protein DPEC_G00214690 [Dallia pectoralis]|uniref:Uncharacterized protein n=1 Tax=Dallia pectoralis TaxID=75939 RepID=A0ACC2G221_DALPE|nr:hypothetical protein DPEC_G00214690 [Dallia pectoralis]
MTLLGASSGKPAKSDEIKDTLLANVDEWSTGIELVADDLNVFTLATETDEEITAKNQEGKLEGEDPSVNKEGEMWEKCMIIKATDQPLDDLSLGVPDDVFNEPKKHRVDNEESGADGEMTGNGQDYNTDKITNLKEEDIPEDKQIRNNIGDFICIENETETRDDSPMQKKNTIEKDWEEAVQEEEEMMMMVIREEAVQEEEEMMMMIREEAVQEEEEMMMMIREEAVQEEEEMMMMIREEAVQEEEEMMMMIREEAVQEEEEMMMMIREEAVQEEEEMMMMIREEAVQEEEEMMMVIQDFQENEMEEETEEQIEEETEEQIEEEAEEQIEEETEEQIEEEAEEQIEEETEEQIEEETEEQVEDLEEDVKGRLREEVVGEQRNKADEHVEVEGIVVDNRNELVDKFCLQTDIEYDGQGDLSTKPNVFEMSDSEKCTLNEGNGRSSCSNDPTLGVTLDVSHDDGKQIDTSGFNVIKTDEKESEDDNTSTESLSDEEMERYMHSLRVAHKTQAMELAVGVGKRPPIGRRSRRPSMPSISESGDEDRLSNRDDRKHLETVKCRSTCTLPLVAGDRDTSRGNEIRSNNIFSWHNLSTGLLYTILFVVFFLVAYHYDFLACFGLYLLSVFWLFCQREKQRLKGNNKLV